MSRFLLNERKYDEPEVDDSFFSSVLPILCRCYSGSIQRIYCDVSQLSSHATYLLMNYSTKNMIIFYGKLSSPMDKLTIERFCYDTIKDDGLNGFDITILHEETMNSVARNTKSNTSDLDDGIKKFLLVFNVTIEEYQYRVKSRMNKTANNPVKFYTLLDKSTQKGDDETGGDIVYSLQLLTVADVCKEDGGVPLIPFLSSDSVYYHKNTILVLVVGDQYDVWLAEEVSPREIYAIRSFLTKNAIKNVSIEKKGMESLLFIRNLRFQKQYFETSLFRSHFLPETAISLMGNVSTSNCTNRPSMANGQNMCMNWLGSTIFNLIGFTGITQSNQDNFFDKTIQKPRISDDYPVKTPLDGTSVLARSNVESTARNKLEKLLLRTNIEYINPPRANTKLLVLDLDHTLLDFSCRFEYDVHRLKRPFMDEFLTAVYKYYDIAIWSQTNFAWLKVKLTGLGMLPNNNYKICFALDKTYMFTYKNNYVKPLKLIWLKSNGRWSEKNTVHIDDLTRNFELNKENGIVISPFFVKSPENASPVEAAGDGEYKTDVDLELSLLGRYLVHIARNSDDFSEIDHENWRDNSILIPPIF